MNSVDDAHPLEGHQGYVLGHGDKRATEDGRDGAHLTGKWIMGRVGRQNQAAAARPGEAGAEGCTNPHTRVVIEDRARRQAEAGNLEAGPGEQTLPAGLPLTGP